MFGLFSVLLPAMFPLGMLSDINMEFMQAFSPLYFVPIVVVIVCAFLVYAFGFKSPVPPPSFEGIEEEKKYPKKRKDKALKKAKLASQKEKQIQKGTSPKPKKREVSETPIAVEKPNVEETETSPVMKKKNKKAHKQSEKNQQKKPAQEKTDVISHDDFNGDGWVRLTKKEKRVKKPKMEIRYVPSVLSFDADTNKSDNSSNVEESPKMKVAPAKDIPAIDKKQKTTGDEKVSTKTTEKGKVVAKTTEKEKVIPKTTENEKVAANTVEKEKLPAKTTPIANVEKVVEDAKPDYANLDKMLLKEIAANEEQQKKPKKKKKKSNKDKEVVVQCERDFVSDYDDSDFLPESPLAENPAQEIKSVMIEDFAPIADVIGKNQEADAKNSNVAFDELEGLYPETKQPKKKKKVRRDH